MYIIFGYNIYYNCIDVHQSTFPYIGNDRNICNLGPDSKPIDFFYLFLNNDVIEMIVRETNRQAKKYKRDWVDTDH